MSWGIWIDTPPNKYYETGWFTDDEGAPYLFECQTDAIAAIDRIAHVAGDRITICPYPRGPLLVPCPETLLETLQRLDRLGLNDDRHRVLLWTLLPKIIEALTPSPVNFPDALAADKAVR